MVDSKIPARKDLAVGTLADFRLLDQAFAPNDHGNYHFQDLQFVYVIEKTHITPSEAKVPPKPH